MMWNAASHLNMFTSFKGLSHLNRIHTLVTWDLPGQKSIFLFLLLNHRKTHKDSIWGTQIGLYFTCEHWTVPMMHCWGWMVIADSKFSCCWHDNSRSRAHSSCRGENGSTLFPSTGHQCKHHLDHAKSAHLHGAHVYKQTAGEREWDRRSLDSNSGGSADAAAEGKTEGDL